MQWSRILGLSGTVAGRWKEWRETLGTNSVLFRRAATGQHGLNRINSRGSIEGITLSPVVEALAQFGRL
jgi:hypothetical protein